MLYLAPAMLFDTSNTPLDIHATRTSEPFTPVATLTRFTTATVTICTYIHKCIRSLLTSLID